MEIDNQNSDEEEEKMEIDNQNSEDYVKYSETVTENENIDMPMN